MISSESRGGSGMLAVFCDLAREWHREFREWLRDDMMPARFRIGGFAHAASYDLIADAPGSIGLPEPFVTVYETASIGDLYGAPYQRLRANRDARDKDFHARFIRPRRHTLSWVGPELARRVGDFAETVVLDSFDVEPARLQGFNIWYMTEHLPRMAENRAVIRVRRYLSMEGAPRHVVLTEVADALAPGIALEAVAVPMPGAGGRIAGIYRRVLAGP